MLNSLSGRVAVGIAVALLLIVLALLTTRGIWFDNPDAAVQRRMDIIGQLIVGIGTAALAVVTWASVYETQQVLAGEDRRFRESRMPLVVLSALPDENAQMGDKTPAFKLTFRNIGDGAAQDVRISAAGTVRLTWQTQKVRLEAGRKVTDPPQGGDYAQGGISEEFVRAGSYLQVNTPTTVFIRQPTLRAPDSADSELVLNESRFLNVTRVTIRYTDVFGEEFTTTHSRKEGKGFLPDFDLVRPEAYTKGRRLTDESP